MKLCLNFVWGFITLCLVQKNLAIVANPNYARQLVYRQSYHIAKEDSRFNLREDWDGIIEFLSKLHGTQKSKKEIVQHITGLGPELNLQWNNESFSVTEEEIRKCYGKYLQVVNDAYDGIPYAVQILDSWGSKESGWLVGNVRWPGHYYECIDVKHDTDKDLNGKWCNSYWGFKDIPYPVAYPVDISFGLCMPQICTKEAIEALLWLSIVGKDTRPRLPLQSVYCPDPPSTYHLSTASIIGIIVSSCIGALLIAGTIFELTDTTRKRQKDDSMFVKMALCFSLVSNGEKILDMSKKPGSIPVLDGIRFISTTWVILGHSYTFMLYSLDNAAYASRLSRESWSLLVISNGTFSVDSFYFLSGLLVAYLGIKHLNKSGGKINIPLMYLQRYMRLTPAYAYAILFSVGLYRYVGKGPFWQELVEFNEESCRYDWWTNLLYITTIYPATPKCYAVAWYLSNDMIFYVLSPFVLLLLYYAFYLGLAVICFLIVGCQVAVALLAYFNGIQPDLISTLQIFTVWIRLVLPEEIPEATMSENFMYNIYTPPWCRYAIYLIGMLTGYLLYRTKHKIKMGKLVVIIGWIVSIGAALALIYGLAGHTQNIEPLSDEMAAFYHGASRPVWALCMAWVVVACSSGYGGPVTKILDWKVFTPLSRLTYSTYISHMLVLQWFIGSQEKPMHFLTVNVAYFYLGSLVISFGIGFLLALAVEWPMIGLLKLAFPPKRATAQPNISAPKMELTNVESSVGDNSSGAKQNLKKAEFRVVTAVEANTNLAFCHENQSIVQDEKGSFKCESGPLAFHSESDSGFTEKVHKF